MKIRHFGNTANNAYYNARLLHENAGIESELPVRMFGLLHAISAPAWESVEFDVPSTAWVPEPDWSLIPGAVEVNARYSDLPAPLGSVGAPPPAPGLSPSALFMTVARAGLGAIHGKPGTQPIFDTSYRLVLARRPILAPGDNTIDMFYGADSLVRVKVPQTTEHLVCLEHGTVRWIADGDRETAVFRRAYRELVQRSKHLWVTNLDPRSLELAEDVAPGRWSAFPHPYIPDARVPFAESEGHRAALLAQTRSERLILLPSSQNWSKHHDKGSRKALEAFVELRRAGHEVGLVAVEWGLQLAESKAFLESEGFGGNVAWVAPMARFGLQRMMADVDVVWDQFGLDAFGALALRAAEQGTPFVSRGLAPEGEKVMGGPVPWLHAESVGDIVRETSAVFEAMDERGRATVVAEFQKHLRGWLLERHSPALTAQLQSDLYARMLNGSFEPGTAAPDAWARLLATGEREEDLDS